MYYDIVLFTGYHSDGNARAFSDFHDVIVKVRFPVGVRNVTEKITIIDDDIHEDTETFWVGLREPLGGKLGDIDSAVITVIDDQSKRGLGKILTIKKNQKNGFYV